MKCPVCVRDGERSRVQNDGAGSTTTMSMSDESYYDEDGAYHRHNPNISLYRYKCSNGHKFTWKYRSGCNVGDCSHEGISKYIADGIEICPDMSSHEVLEARIVSK